MEESSDVGESEADAPGNGLARVSTVEEAVRILNDTAQTYHLAYRSHSASPEMHALS